MKINKIYILPIVATVLLNSCSIYKKYSRPEEITTDHLYGDQFLSNDTTTLAHKSWKELFVDQKLQQLIALGIENNADLQTAKLRVEQAEASLRSAKLSRLPSLSLAPQGTVSSWDGASASKGYMLPVSASWEIDIFAKQLNASRAAQSSLMQTKEYQLAVKSGVVAAIANTYYTLLMLDKQVEITNQTVISWQKSINVLQSMKDAGMQNEAAVSRAKANLHMLETTFTQLKNSVQNVENQLSLLVMQPIQTINRGTIDQNFFQEELSIGCSVQLLANRPDVRASEYALSKSLYGLNQTRGALYPSLVLSGSAGWTNSLGGMIVDPAGTILSAVGSLTQPLFNGGRLRANVKIQKAEYDIAVINFQQSLFAAGVEVNDALRKCQLARTNKSQYEMQIELLTKTIKSTELLMKHGSTTYLEVLTAQQALHQAQLAEVGNWLDEAQGVVTLYRALGGGVQ